MKTLFITTANMPNAWARAVQAVMKNGSESTTDYGTNTKEMASTIIVKFPMESLMLHPQCPTREKHLEKYIAQWTKDFDWLNQGFEYSYMDRLTHYPAAAPVCDKLLRCASDANAPKIPPYYHSHRDIFIDQIERMKLQLKSGQTRRCQAITWIPSRDSRVNEDQPCLQRIWMKRTTGSFVDLHCTWRSRDLYGAWLANYIALFTMVKREILDPLQLRIGNLVDFVDSLHIYESDWSAARQVELAPELPRTINIAQVVIGI